MKRLFGIILCIISILTIGNTCVLADRQRLNFGMYNINGEKQGAPYAYVSDLVIKDDIYGEFVKSDSISSKIEISENILSKANNDDCFIIMDFKTDNEDNPYPDIEKIDVRIQFSYSTGNRSMGFGKSYRLFYENSTSDLIDISDNIKQSNYYRIDFELKKLGKYILFFDPNVLNVTFYLEEPVYEDDTWINQDCVYKQIENLAYRDIIEFPEIPQKEGYIFTGWKTCPVGNGSTGMSLVYPEPQPICGGAYRQLYATWIPEDEYEPINIEISSDKSIIKGKEDGRKIILKTNYGAFDENEYFPTEWRTEYDAETDEEYKEDILSEWKSTWNIVGNDDLLIESVRLIDNKTVELTLLGNSDDIYTDTDIYIEFDSSILNSEPEIRENEIYYPADTKIKMDKDGVRAKMYRSDNAVKLSKQRKPMSGGSSSRPTQYTVTFNTNGGNSIAKQSIERNTSAKEPEAPQKEGYSFIGWYADKELLNEFDFAKKIAKDTTLYAKWEEKDLTENQIILTIGQKEALVFGEKITNDVAPQIVNDFTMLPLRFVAENLGATVKWSDKTPDIVTITKDESEIVIYIGEDYVLLNGEKVHFDIPAFIENDRTFVPARFVYESLGADVDWNEENQSVIISVQEL